MFGSEIRFGRIFTRIRSLRSLPGKKKKRRKTRERREEKRRILSSILFLPICNRRISNFEENHKQINRIPRRHHVSQRWLGLDEDLNKAVVIKFLSRPFFLLPSSGGGGGGTRARIISDAVRPPRERWPSYAIASTTKHYGPPIHRYFFSSLPLCKSSIQ